MLYYTTFLDMLDAHVERSTASICPTTPPRGRCCPIPPCVTAPLQRLDLAAEGIGAVIWATGYGVDFGWIDIPVLDARGEPVHRGGITDVPGLYFLGLPWLSKMNSAFLSGRRRRCRRARRSYFRPRLNSAALAPFRCRKNTGNVNRFTWARRRVVVLLSPDQSRETRHDLRRL